ncbi:DUF4815 domain-containing protein [Roseibium algae]|uniref:DUF4815 domain-containing protein n=1 Tax=Roseibium algae TaxID=3123038 RepID=A0ABU8TJZ0_9HYPH
MFEHKSGLPATHDRGPENPDRTGLVFSEGNFLQGSELNELQTILRTQVASVGDLIAKDGDRRSGAGIVVVPDVNPLDPNAPALTATLQFEAGRVYVGGRVLLIEAREIANVSIVGDVRAGVRLQTSYITHEDDPTLLGLEPGTLSENEPGAAREVQGLIWSIEGDGGVGDFFPVYLLHAGTVIDQAPPPSLTGVLETLSVYDAQANGHYIVDGCNVVPLGKDGADQVFSITAGTANIQGWKRKREAAIRFPVTEKPQLETIVAEPHVFATAGTSIIEVSRPPIAVVTSAIVTKQITESVIRGAVPGGSDGLSQSSIVEIQSVKQGQVTFDPSEYSLTGDMISWAPVGDEPLQASTYSVTYLYNDVVTPDAVSETSVTLSGGVQGRSVLISYTSKLPRIDLVCLNLEGLPEYVEGISARKGALPPAAPADLLKLAEVHNDWQGTPEIIANGTRNYTFDQQRRFFDFLIKMARQFDRSESERDVQSRAAVSADGIFTESFTDDFYRDQGEPQTAAINQGVLQLAVDVVGVQASEDLAALDWTETVLVAQGLASSEMKINPYANFNTMPGDLRLSPPVDFWTDHVTQWASPVTQEFTAAPDTPPGTTSLNEEVSESVSSAKVLRQIDINYDLAGFGAGENLESLTFDGIDVTPAPVLVADGVGQISGTFKIPALVPTGSRVVRAQGAAGSFAEAFFVGEGTIETEVMRRVTLVSRAAPPPVTIINNIVNVTNTVTNNNGGQNDPLAQTFSLVAGGHVAGVDIRAGTIGNPDNGVRVQLATTLNGYPTNELLAETFLPMQGVSPGDILQARFDVPVYLPSNRQFCFVVLTDDADHSLAIARVGEVDPENQTRVSSQPYTVGVLFSSSNRLAWEAHNDADLWFNIVGAQFSPLEKTVVLWTGELDRVSDIIVRGTVDIPTGAARFRYELVRENGDVHALAPGQSIEFDDFLTETVTLRAVLSGSADVSPILYPGTSLVFGRVRSEGTYVSRVFPIAGGTKCVAVFASSQPAGSEIDVRVDQADDNWQGLAPVSTRQLGGGWNEPVHELDAFTAPLGGRVRVRLSGSPAARPSIARLRAFGF